MLKDAGFEPVIEYPYSIASGIFRDLPFARKIPLHGLNGSRYYKADKYVDDYLNAIGKLIYKYAQLVPNLFALHYGIISQKTVISK